MKRISLRPYYGEIWVCTSRKELREVYAKRTRQPYPYVDDDPDGGRYVDLGACWLIWGGTRNALVHEVCHVLLHTFGAIGHNPTKGDGEPFCYLMSHVLQELP